MSVRLLDAETHEPLVLAPVTVPALDLVVQTDTAGCAELTLPRGRYRLRAAYMGYAAGERDIDLTHAAPLSPDTGTATSATPATAGTTLTLLLHRQSLKLGEAVVTARRNLTGEATSSTIDRTAMDHLQATSLADMMQLLPGQLMGNADLTARQGLQLRTLSNNATAALGASIVVDGVPLSTAGILSAGGFNAQTAAGSDLRQVSADALERVEVVRGIPSAEHGDLTSGLVLVQTRSGVAPWEWRTKVHPGLVNHSLSKGIRIAGAGVWNATIDYAKAWGDPRQKTRSFHRYTLRLGWNRQIRKGWNIDTRLQLLSAKDWTGQDPDAVADGTKAEHATYALNLTHNGTLRLNRAAARTIAYTLGLQYSPGNAVNTSFVAASTGLIPLITATTSGYHPVAWRTASYLASGRTENRPLHLFARVSDSFFLRAGRTLHAFKIGAEYKVDHNTGRGYFNLDDTAPLRPNSNGRPRAFGEVPALHQLAAFVDDKFSWHIDHARRLHLQAGLRFQSVQPWAAERLFALSPRLNAALTLTPWLEVHSGVGLSSKTPGLDLLYPDRHYTDRVAVNYMPQDDPAAQTLIYHTEVYAAARSKGLRNATSTKWEAGVEIRLPGHRSLTLTAYHDRTPDGFSTLTDYYTYTANVYTPDRGLIIAPGTATRVDYAHPARTDLIFATKGTVGNTDVSVNRGIEADFALGEIRALRTTVFLSGACQESRTHSTGLNATNPVGLPTSYVSTSTTPVKLIYPSALDFARQRRFLQTIRLVTHLPALRMVASLTGQVVWHNSTLSFVAPKDPTGWIDDRLQVHQLTPAMQQGFLGTDGQYYATAPAGTESISLAAQAVRPKDNVATTSPTTWNVSARLTKELGNMATLSLYLNNALFYEPFRAASTSTTLTQRNTGTFAFGIELSIKL